MITAQRPPCLHTEIPFENQAALSRAHSTKPASDVAMETNGQELPIGQKLGSWRGRDKNSGERSLLSQPPTHPQATRIPTARWDNLGTYSITRSGSLCNYCSVGFDDCYELEPVVFFLFFLFSNRFKVYRYIGYPIPAPKFITGRLEDRSLVF